YVIAFQYAVLAAFGVPRFVWRYTSLREVTRIGLALSAAAAVLLAVRLLAGALLERGTGYALYALVPIGVIAIDLVLAFLAVAGVRGLRRALSERSARARHEREPVEQVPTLLIGAG